MNEKNIELVNKILDITVERICAYIIEKGDMSLISEYSFLFARITPEKTSEGMKEKILSDILECESIIRGSLDEGIVLRMEYLTRRTTPVSQTVFGLCILEFLYPELTGMYEKLGSNGVTVELAARITYGLNTPFLYLYDEMREATDVLSKWFYIEPVSHAGLSRVRYMMDERLWAFILGKDSIDTMYNYAGKVCLDSPEEEFIFHNELKDRLIEKIKMTHMNEQVLFHIQGAKGAGKRFLAQNGEYECGNSTVYIDYEVLKASDLKEARKTVWYFYRECAFYQAVPVFYGLTEELVPNREETEGFLALCVYPYIGRCPRIYVLTDIMTDIAPYTNIPVFKIVINDLTREERITLWGKYCERMECETEFDVNTVGTKYHLNADSIKLAVDHIHRREEAGLSVDDKVVADLCNELMPAPAAGSIQKINAQYTFDDIKLPNAQKKLLMSVCNHIWQRHKVFDSWEMDKVFSYGKGVSILFAGPPGTGKTMGAHVISSMLGLPLYRVDLSQITSKYVGESEKKLEGVFQAAEQSNMILFFDEADSVFGKRSEVKEANDRYANTEVSYILQRMETYEGVVILATNYRQNIDEAFMRRMRYVVEFSMPNAKLREEIWRSCFTDKVPTADIDFAFLAEKYNLSGGNIKNIVLNAVFAAASEDQPVNMIHILEALRMEKIKTGQLMIAKDFGIYSTVMEEIIMEDSNKE